jgi:hypothetical protein
MGHNVDLGMFGVTSIKCKNCGKDLDLSETDIDCDIITHNPMMFELHTLCYECDYNNKIKFEIKVR